MEVLGAGQTMNAWWQMFRRAFTPQECQALIDYGLEQPLIEARIGYGGDPHLDTKMRRSQIRWFRRDDKQLELFYDRLWRMGRQANKAFGFDLRDCGSAQFTVYESSNEGHFDWHLDNAFKTNGKHDRKMSMVIQLSDTSTYEGGRLELQSDPLPPNMFVDQGDTIFFPSFNRHRVTPVTKGVRYSCVVWFEGPPFR
jgi:PKHD-type hydroxylase